MNAAIYVRVKGCATRSGWFGLTWLIACSQTPAMLRESCVAEPISGLYEVTARKCENPLQETDYCPLTQYLEVAPGETFDVADAPRVLAFWYAEAPESPDYGNEVHVLRGRCESANRYILERDSNGEAWLRLNDGIPVEYHFVGYTQHTPPKLMFRMQLSLRRATRTPELAKRLYIERD